MNELIKICYKYGFRIEIEKDTMIRGVSVKIFDLVDHLGRSFGITNDEIENSNCNFEEVLLKEIIKEFDIEKEDMAP